MSDCRFGVSPVNYPDLDPDASLQFSANTHFSYNPYFHGNVNETVN